jgi:hypothetical protein
VSSSQALKAEVSSPVPKKRQPVALELMGLAQKVVEEVFDFASGTGHPDVAVDVESLWAQLEDCTAPERRAKGPP